MVKIIIGSLVNKSLTNACKAATTRRCWCFHQQRSHAAGNTTRRNFVGENTNKGEDDLRLTDY